jgi:hypothetical protein
MLVSANGPFDGNKTCDQLLDPDTATTDPVFFVSLGQSLDGFKASVNTIPSGDNGTDVVTFDEKSSGTIGSGTITIKRDPIIRAFNVLLFIGE